jgi:hypothetical protein
MHNLQSDSHRIMAYYRFEFMLLISLNKELVKNIKQIKKF